MRTWLTRDGVILLIVWLIMVGLVSGQVVWGVVLDGRWRQWYRRKENPVGFWTVIGIQSVMLLVAAIVWILIIQSEPQR